MSDSVSIEFVRQVVLQCSVFVLGEWGLKHESK